MERRSGNLNDFARFPSAFKPRTHPPIQDAFPRGVDEGAERHDLKALGPRIRDKLCQHRQTRAAAAKAVGHGGMVGDHQRRAGDRLGDLGFFTVLADDLAALVRAMFADNFSQRWCPRLRRATRPR